MVKLIFDVIDDQERAGLIKGALALLKHAGVSMSVEEQTCGNAIFKITCSISTSETRDCGVEIESHDIEKQVHQEENGGNNGM